MASSSHQPTSLSFRFFVGLAGIGLSVAFLHTYAQFFNALALAAIVVMTVSPLIYWLRRHRVPQGLAVLVGLLVSLAAVLAVAFFVITTISSLLRLIPEYMAPMSELTANVQQQMAELGITAEQVRASVDAQRLLALASRILNGILSSVSFFGLMLLMILFMPAEALSLPAKVEQQLRIGNRRFLRVYRFSSSIRRYVAITTLLGLGGGIVIGIILYLLGVPFAGLWGTLFFVMSYVPVLGFWIALIPPLFISFTQLGPEVALIVLLVYMILSFVIQQVLRPSMMKDSLDLSPLWSLLSLIFWGTVLGAPGMIIGVPLTIAIKVLVLESDPDSQWVAAMMSASAEPKEEPSLLVDEATEPAAE